jgi:hypothetical protein
MTNPIKSLWREAGRNVTSLAIYATLTIAVLVTMCAAWWTGRECEPGSEKENR